MKISKLFHWLYASLMFLPLLVAPIFAIYSHRHEINDYSIQVQETIVVDFNQQIQNDYIHYQHTYSGNQWVPVPTNPFGLSGTNHKVLCKLGNLSLSGTGNFYVYLQDGDNQNHYSSFIDTISSDETRLNCVGTDVEVDVYFNLYDLTQMFGVGNEPSLEDFLSWYDADYYPYTLSHRELLKTGNYITYDDTDIGSQFLYDLYNTTDKYLNFDSVLNLYQVNDWINLNVFNGSVPLVWYIIWHYLDYWLLLSIFWLCFDVLIYVPQLAHRWLDKASLE